MDALQSNFSSSLLSVPLDVIEHHIFALLKRRDLLSCAMACSKLGKIFLNFFSISKETKLSFQAGVMSDIFRSGTLQQLTWTIRTFRYPTLEEFPKRLEMVSLAAQCKWQFFLCVK